MGLNAYKDTGEILFDTNLICYGLVKSGYMAYSQSWSRRQLLSAQLDPNDGGNYSPVSVTVDPTHTDGLFGFTVYNAISPIVFIVGTGTLNGTARTGDAVTFYYSNAGTDTKYYCFDLMGDNIAGSTFLKTWDATGRITFNSLQPPLNVIATIQAPTPGSLDGGGRYLTTYVGGYNVERAELGPASPNRRPRLDSRVDIALTAGVEYAAYLPWSRTCMINDLFDFTGYQSSTTYGGQEGAYGRVGGMSFMFGASAGTTWSQLPTPGQSLPCSFRNLPIDRYPVALVIATASLPFPFN